MQCTMCGREINNPDANYCEYCGTAVGTEVYREVQKEPQKTSVYEPKEDRVSTWLLLGVMCLMFVPVVGFFAHIGILLYWAFAASIEDSRKSFARAILIYEAVTLMFSFLVLGMMMGSMVTTVALVPGLV